jgi:hypothetical protein
MDHVACNFILTIEDIVLSPLRVNLDYLTQRTTTKIFAYEQKLEDHLSSKIRRDHLLAINYQIITPAYKGV